MDPVKVFAYAYKNGQNIPMSYFAPIKLKDNGDGNGGYISEWSIGITLPSQSDLDAITQQDIDNYLLTQNLEKTKSKDYFNPMKAMLKYANPSINVDDSNNIREIFSYASQGKPKFNRTKENINVINNNTQINGITLAGSIYNLNPVVYNYAQSPNSYNTAYCRLVSSDVNNVLPAVVYKNKDDGTVETIDYKGLTVMLLYELKKLEARITSYGIP